jgi:hypothetical protein
MNTYASWGHDFRCSLESRDGVFRIGCCSLALMYYYHLAVFIHVDVHPILSDFSQSPVDAAGSLPNERNSLFLRRLQRVL